MTTRATKPETSGVRSKGRPKLEEAAEIDRAIRDATINALLEHGEAATLNAIAQTAGLSRKSVYARYSSKSELFVQVLREMLAGGEGVQFDSSGTAQERLFNYLEAALDLIAAPQARAIHRLLTVDPGYIAALRSEMLDATHRHFLLPLHSLLDQAHRSGEFIVEDLDSTARVLIKLIFAESMNHEKQAHTWLTSDSSENYARFLTRLVTLGLLPRK